MENLTIVVRTLEYYNPLGNANFSLVYEKTETFHGISKSECVKKYYEKVNQYLEKYEAEKISTTASKIAYGLTKYEFRPNLNVFYYVELHNSNVLVDTQGLGWLNLEENFDEEFMRRELELVLGAASY